MYKVNTRGEYQQESDDTIHTAIHRSLHDTQDSTRDIIADFRFNTHP